MDRMNISGNTGDMGIAGFVKPTSLAQANQSPKDVESLLKFAS